MVKTEDIEVAAAPFDEESIVSSNVPAKYHGTPTDRYDMTVLGKKQVLRRQFGFRSMMGFSSTVMVAWEFVLFTSPFTLEDGGAPGVFWGLLISPFVMVPIYASLAEVASMSPTAGGQYHFVSELAPKSVQKGLSYSVGTEQMNQHAIVEVKTNRMTGWLIALGWQAYLCGVCFVVAGLIVGLVELNVPSYEIQSWHTTLLTICIAWLCAAFNAFLANRLPIMEAFAGILHVVGVFVVIIPLWITARHGNAHETIFAFVDNGGWGNTALASTIGIIPMIGMLVGYDCAIHMSEECEDASKTIPNVVVWGVSSNAVLLLVVGITYVFCLGDIKSALNTSTYQPVIQVFFNATQSYVGTTIMASVITVILFSSAIGQVATSSRQMWSFSRDKGFPGFPWLEQVTPGSNIPLRAIALSAATTSLLSLINIGSYEALNAFNSLGTVSILFSYTMTIGCLTWRRLFGVPLPPRRWSLGTYGLWINILSLCFIIPLLFFYMWPLTHPVTPQNMNWSSAMFGSVLLIAILYYVVKGRFVYEGPVTYMKREQ